jgi:hypothetical protein
VREHLGWWATTKSFFCLHNLPEIIKQKISQTAEIFSSMRIFPECPKCLGMNEKHLQHNKVPIIIGQNKKSQNAQIFLAVGLFQNAQIFWAEIKNSTFMTFLVMLKFPK